jgi:hypothetical protein
MNEYLMRHETTFKNYISYEGTNKTSIYKVFNRFANDWKILINNYD